MSRAGLKPSAAITRGMTDTQAAMVNSRWLRHSAAGVSAAATARTLAASGPASQEISGGHSRKSARRSGAAACLRRGAAVAAALARSEVGHRFPSSWLLNNSGLPCEPRTIRPAAEPLDAAALRRAAVRPGGLWREIEVVESTGSTNADLLARALRRRAGGRGAGRRGAARGPRPDGPHLDLAAARRADLLAAAEAGRAARPPRLAPAADRRGRRRRGHRGDRRRDQAEMAERRAWRPTPSSRASWPRRPATRSSSASASTCPPNPRSSLAPAPARCPPPRCARPARPRLDRGGTAARHPGRIRALVPGLAAGRRRPGPQRPAPRIHPAVRHDRPHRPGRTPRRSGALRPGRRRRFRRQAAGPRLARASEVAVAAGDVVHLR